MTGLGRCDSSYRSDRRHYNFTASALLRHDSYRRLIIFELCAVDIVCFAQEFAARWSEWDSLWYRRDKLHNTYLFWILDARFDGVKLFQKHSPKSLFVHEEVYSDLWLSACTLWPQTN